MAVKAGAPIGNIL